MLGDSLSMRRAKSGLATPGSREVLEYALSDNAERDADDRLFPDADAEAVWEWLSGDDLAPAPPAVADVLRGALDDDSERDEYDRSFDEVETAEAEALWGALTRSAVRNPSEVPPYPEELGPNTRGGRGWVREMRQAWRDYHVGEREQHDWAGELLHQGGISPHHRWRPPEEGTTLHLPMQFSADQDLGYGAGEVLDHIGDWARDQGYEVDSNDDSDVTIWVSGVTGVLVFTTTNEGQLVFAPFITGSRGPADDPDGDYWVNDQMALSAGPERRVMITSDYIAALKKTLLHTTVEIGDRDIEEWEDVASSCDTASEFLAEMSDLGEPATPAMRAYANNFFS